jgi:hypothetical protein
MREFTLRRLARVVAICLATASLGASCILAPDPEPAAGDIMVQFAAANPAQPPLLLYSGMLAASCDSFTPFVSANAQVLLTDVSFDPACTVEVDAFAPGSGAFAQIVNTQDVNGEDWLLQAIDAGSMEISLPGLTSVPLRLWLVTDVAMVSSVEAVRNRLLDKAYPVFSTFGTGITFDTLSTVLAPALIPTADCLAAPGMSSNSSIYDASRINVYFVHHYGNNPTLTPAQNCWLKSHPEIIFISWSNENLTDPTLAHELGHALGLTNPTSLGGHTYGIPDFDDYNLMATNTDVTDVTLGQLYALNFSSGSWINRPGSSLLKSVVRECQNSWGTGVCPALTLKDTGWPP